MSYQLYYWPTIQGRGEFVRLALEEAQAPYDDVARGDGGIDKLMHKMRHGAHPAFAPPFLVVGGHTIGQVATILQFLGDTHGLAPRAPAARLWVNQLQLTIADIVAEVHDTHHPLSVAWTYEQQMAAAAQRAAAFVDARMPKFFDYFEGVLEQKGSGDWLLGKQVSYADLSLFQLLEGVRYAFPKAMARLEPDYPQLQALREKVAERPRIAAYLASPRRLPFSEEGIFRHYAQLDR